MNEPLVTIGIPFYNAADTLLDAVRSVFAQTYQNWELILAVDGSADGSDELARQIRDDRVRVIGDDKRRFLSYRLNQITREARGQFIVRMDADDLCTPNRIEKQISFLQNHPDIDGCGTGMFAMNGNLELVGRHCPVQTHEEICSNPMKGIYISHATFSGKTEWFRQNPYDERFRCSQDWDIWLRTYQTSRFANLPEPLYFYRGVGTVPLKRYIQVKQTVAQVLLRSNPQTGALWQRMYHAGRQYVEMGAYIVLSLFGKAHKFSGRRGQPVAQEEIETFGSIMEKIRTTGVPLSK